MNQVIPNVENLTAIRIGHPAGVLPVVAEVEGTTVKKAALIRTARRLMEGYALVLNDD